MGRLRTRAPYSLLGLLLLASSGCGGGSSYTQPPPPPPPQPDFSISFSQNSVSLQQGATSAPINILVNPLNGFTGTVQVTLSGVPAGVISNPASPFNVAAGSSTPILFSAAANASIGNFTVAAEGVSGSLSHPANLGLAVQAGVIAGLPRTT